jgi:ABC-type multidrug transport system fused ATPase/permease subunit
MFKHSLLLKYAIKHLILILSTIILGFSGAIFNGIGTTLIVPLLLAFLGQQKELFKDTPPLIQKALNLFSGLNERERLLCLFGTILLAIILKNMATYGNSLVSSRLSQNLVSDIRLESLRIALEVDLDFYAKHKTGHILNTINEEVARVASGIRSLINLSTTVITISVFV